MKRLSVCMIVKDEEELLPQCLNSVTKLADEIIIVDTGSTDRTKQIAAEYSAQVYEYTWTNDFAAARNESLRHASGTWILVLDADEYLPEEELDRWNDFLNTEQPLDYLAYTLPVINFTGSKGQQDEITTAPVTRLFPNHKGIVFERPIHEQLTRGMRGELFHKKIALSIYHTGYQHERVTDRNKHERNMAIFNEMKKNKAFSDYDWFTLGNQYRYAKEEDEALRCYEKALQGNNADSAWYPHCLIGLICLYFQQDRLQLADQWTGKLSQFAEFAEYHTIKGIQYEALGFYEQAVACYLKAVEVAEQRARRGDEIWLIDPGYSFESPVSQMVGVYFKLNNNQQGIYWLSKLLHKNKRNLQVLLRLVEWLCHNENSASVITFLDNIYDKGHDADRILLRKVSLVLGQLDLVRHYLKEEEVSELAPLDQLRLAVLTGDQAGWFAYHPVQCDFDADRAIHVWVQLAVGAIRWNYPDQLKARAASFQNSEVSELTELIVSFITGNTSTDQLNSGRYSTTLFLVAKQLFLIKDYENFDRFVQGLRSPELVNQLANYFYGLNLTKMAMDYYSVLLSKQQLDYFSLENLGMYHANHQYYDDAVEFLSEAVKLQPKARHLYYSLIRYANNERKSIFISKFIEQFPEYENIPFVRDFLSAGIVN